MGIWYIATAIFDNHRGVMTYTGQTVERLPLLNKLLFDADHVGLHSMSYFRRQWVLFFLAPPALAGVSRVPDVVRVMAPETENFAVRLARME